MGIQVIYINNNDLGMRKDHIRKFLHRNCPISSRTLIGNLDIPFACQRLKEQISQQPLPADTHNPPDEVDLVAQKVVHGYR